MCATTRVQTHKCLIMYVHTHTHTHTLVCVYVRTHAHTHAHTHTHTNTHIHTPECAQPGSEPKRQTSIYVYTHPLTHTYTCVNVHTHTNTHLCVPSRGPSQGDIPPTTPARAWARIRIQCRQKYSGISLCMCDIFTKITERPHPRHLLVHVRKSEHSGVKNTEISVCVCVMYLYIHSREK